MYEELVGDLRYCDKGDCNGCRRHTKDTRFCYSLLREAADAIEELSASVEGFKSTTNMVFEETEGRTVLKFEPKWIPVTERLPEDDGMYLVCGRWRGKPIEIWVCERITLGPIKGWADSVSNPVISHWMPLPPAPEPPKEEA